MLSLLVERNRTFTELEEMLPQTESLKATPQVC